MNQTVKTILTYFIIAFVAMGLSKSCDWITKKPTLVDRSDDPKITELNKRIDGILDSVAMYKKQSSESFKSAMLSLDSIRIDHRKSKNEHKKLKNTPDAELIHYRDSVRKANGL